MTGIAHATGSLGIPPSLIDSVGEAHFSAQLVRYLWEQFAAEHCAVFVFENGLPVEMLSGSLDGSDTAHRQTELYLRSQYWRRDPTMTAARRDIGLASHGLHQLDIGHLSNTDFRDTIYSRTDICERILVVGQASSMNFGLSILRSNTKGHFSEREIEAIRTYSAVLLALLGRHVRFVSPNVDLSLALTSLTQIEQCIATSTESLPRREAEVCARILYGVSSVGIASSLGIGEETVTTYRKRAYQRLGIASQRELLIWYLRSWSRGRSLSSLSDEAKSTKPQIK